MLEVEFWPGVKEIEGKKIEREKTTELKVFKLVTLGFKDPS
jgi:hypothetical protein